MKKVITLKSIMMCLALGFAVLAFPANAEAAEPKDMAAITGSSITYTIDWAAEEVSIDAGAVSELYFAAAKDETTEVKATAWDEAILDDDDTFIIDLSTISSSKNSYIAVSLDGEKEEGRFLIPAAAKKTAFVLNLLEGADAYDFVSKVTVIEIDKTETVYTQTGTPKVTDLDISYRKSDGTWHSLADLTEARIKTFVKSGATLYFRVEGSNTMRTSKSVKIKVAKQANKPSVKLDLSKVSYAIKNGMEYSVDGGDTWTTILPYAKSGTASGSAIFNTSYIPAEKTELGSYTATKISAVEIDDILGTGWATGTSIKIRTAATTKKPASKVLTIKTPGTQAAAPTVGTANIVATGSTITYGVAVTTSVAKVEYAIVGKTELDAGKISLTDIKWSSVKVEDNQIKLKSTAKSKFKVEGTTTEFLFSNVGQAAASQGTYLLVREPAVKADTKVASKYAIFDTTLPTN